MLKQSYGCFRTMEFGDMNIRYRVHKENISTYINILLVT